MRLRTAIKIQRFYEEPIDRKGRIRRKGIRLPYNASQYEKSRTICKRHWMDHRVPYIPSDDELNDRAEMQMCIFADAFIKDEDERDAFKEMALLELSKCSS